MKKVRHITAFRSITKASVDVSFSRFYRRNNMFPSLANSTATCTVIVLYQLLITKLSVTISVSALYKPPNVSIDDITQQM